MPSDLSPFNPQNSLTSILNDKTILIVEDNIGNFMLIARMLSNYGVHCEWKTSGFEVVEFARTLIKLDLVLMDIHLPYEDGYSAMRKIRQTSSFKGIPIIAVTADTGLAQMHSAQLAGFDGFIGKPLNPDRFPEQVSKILSHKPVWEFN
jgi:two-component system, cell cycle response regulator DivK